MPVESLFPYGGGCIELASSSGWSRVLGIDAGGSPPHGDFAEEGGARVAARCCPYGLFAAMAGAGSDLICETGNEL
jgi:hypothetical protein